MRETISGDRSRTNACESQFRPTKPIDADVWLMVLAGLAAAAVTFVASFRF